MTDEQIEQTSALVLKNATGDYFLVPQETLEEWRVAEGRKAEVDRLLAEQQEDVQGYIVPFLIAGAVAFGGGMTIGALTTDAILDANTGTLRGLRR